MQVFKKKNQITPEKVLSIKHLLYNENQSYVPNHNTAVLIGTVSSKPTMVQSFVVWDTACPHTLLV